MENTRNQNGIGENEILVVSFGTSYPESRRACIGAIEDAIEAAFPAYSVRRAFTSRMILRHLREKEETWIDNPREALARAAQNGVKKLLVQPTHVMDGLEYHDLLEEVAAASGSFAQTAVGAPLLSAEADYDAVIEAVTKDTAAYDDGETAVVLMGHGTEAAANGVYARMQRRLKEKGFQNYFIGTVEASPALEDVAAMVGSHRYSRVVLQPLMIVAGDHANNDMAGSGKDSWKSVFEASGYEVVTVIRGLGEMEEIQSLFAEHARAAMADLEAEEG